MAGSRVGVLFDMDYTLLRGSSGMLYLRYLLRVGYIPWTRWLRILGLVGLYALGVWDYPRLMARLMAQAAGTSEAEAWRLSREWHDAMLWRYIAQDARERVVWHQAQGHHVAIVSGATVYAVQPVAKALGLDSHFLATRLEVVNGHFTGRVDEPACFGAGKVTMSRAYAADHGFDLPRSFFYSDSHHDLPLLEAVGHPVAVNPSRKLAHIAAQRGWPVEYFR
jgi:HAD superfamily hydrolase (TIGR01490 family)